MEINRLAWGCRRGMLELDLVLEPFLKDVYSTLAQEDKERFWALLEEEDQDLFAWFMGHKDPENSETMKIVQIIRDNTGMKPV